MDHVSDNTGVSRPVRGNIADIEARLSQGWFPVNPQLTAKIRAGLSSGCYSRDINLLIEELKGDISLFAHCLRRLFEIARGREAAYVAPDNPIDLIRGAAFEDLRSVLTTADTDISSQRLRDMSVEQAERLQQTMVVTCVVENLCDGEDIDPELGFVTSLLRQLGITLIAWNYPHLYRRTVASLKYGQSLDEALTKVLGFSPPMLAVTIARKWGVSPGMRVAVGDAQARAACSDPELLARGERLEKLCRIGEVLAQASSSYEYPAPQGEWADARAEIQTRLGAAGFSLLQDRVFKACEMYLNYMPHMFALPAWEPAPPLPASHLGLHLMTRNAYITQCPARVRSLIERSYRSLDRNTISKDLINAFSRELVPQAGFPKGCVYLADPETAALVPRLALGTASLRSFQKVPYSAGRADPIAAAFSGNAPIAEYNVPSGDAKVSYLAGVLGIVQRSGVLYLEIAEGLAAQPGANMQGRYKALRQLLCDILNLY